MSPKNGHCFDQRDGATSLWAKAEGIEIVHPGTEKASKWPNFRLSVPEGARRKMERDFLQGHIVTEIVEITSNWDRIVLS